MKTLLCGLLFFLLSCGDSTHKEEPKTIKDFQWAQLTTTPDSIDFPKYVKNDDISFINKDVGWAISSIAAEVYHTKDGGNTWELQFKAPRVKDKPRPYFRSIGFISKDIGYVGLLNGKEYGHIVFETRDGGKTWNPVSQIDNSPMEGVCAMYPVNTKSIYIAGRIDGKAYVAKSLDEGVTWKIYDVNHKIEQITDVFFWDENHGFIIGGKREPKNPDGHILFYSNSVILETQNGGETWETRYQSDRVTEWCWKMSFPSKNIGYVSIQSFRGYWGTMFETEYFLKTIDGGKTWKSMVLADKEENYFNQQGIGFITDKIGWIGSYLPDHPMMYTEDGGETWHKTEHPGTVNRFRFLQDKTAYAIGSHIFKMEF